MTIDFGEKAERITSNVDKRLYQHLANVTKFIDIQVCEKNSHETQRSLRFFLVNIKQMKN